jgi:hypothetical protein
MAMSKNTENKMTTLQINQENRRLQEIKRTLQGQYAEKFHRVNQGHDESAGLVALRSEITCVERRIKENWKLHGASAKVAFILDEEWEAKIRAREAAEHL